jgi:uncharacterized protein YukE
VISRLMFVSAAAEIRSVEAVLAGAIAQLQDANVWSGADAERFQREWNDLVSSRLDAAAHKVDTVALIQMP